MNLLEPETSEGLIDVISDTMKTNTTLERYDIRFNTMGETGCFTLLTLLTLLALLYHLLCKYAKIFQNIILSSIANKFSSS